MAYRKWNWQQAKWPQFSYNQEALKSLEYQFMQANGIALGAFKHVQNDEKDELLIEILVNEALKTSEIEGEYLDRDSVQESIKKNLGLDSTKRKLPPAEFGISEMMVNLYQTYDKPLAHDQLFQWHTMLTNGRRDLVDIGRYRTHEDPMQVVSGRLDRQTASLISFERKGSTALLYFPCRITSILTPVFSCKSLKNNTSEDNPLKSNTPTGFIKIESATLAR